MQFGREKKKKTSLRHSRPQYTLNLYTTPPGGHVDLEEFKDWAILRYKGYSVVNPQISPGPSNFDLIFDHCYN